MAVAVSQYKTTTDTNAFADDGIAAVTLDAQAGVGGFLVVSIAVTQTTARSVSSVTDDGGNTYALLSAGGTDATQGETTFNSGEVWIYGAPITTPATTVTVTLSAAVGDTGRLTVYHLTGQHATTPTEDVAVHSDTTGTSHAVGSVTTAAAGNVLIGIRAGSSGTYTNEAGWIETDNISAGFGAVIGAYDTVDAATTSWTITTGGNESTVAALVAIQPAEEAPPAAINDALLVIRRA